MNIKLIFAFALGAVAGYFAKYALDKRKSTEDEEEVVYEDIVKDYSGDDDEPSDEYVTYASIDDEAPKLEKETTIYDPKIEVIDPKDFGLDTTFDKVTWTVYNGGVVANENDIIVEDKKSYIGDALEHIGEYEDDIVCVKNDIFRLYIEIAYDPRDYSVAMGVKE